MKYVTRPRGAQRGDRMTAIAFRAIELHGREMWRRENAIFNNRAYFDHIPRLAEAAGVAVWLNAKEIGFSDEVLDYRPDIVKAGAICPSHPFLFEYVEAKTAERGRSLLGANRVHWARTTVTTALAPITSPIA